MFEYRYTSELKERKEKKGKGGGEGLLYEKKGEVVDVYGWMVCAAVVAGNGNLARRMMMSLVAPPFYPMCGTTIPPEINSVGGLKINVISGGTLLVANITLSDIRV